MADASFIVRGLQKARLRFLKILAQGKSYSSHQEQASCGVQFYQKITNFTSIVFQKELERHFAEWICMNNGIFDDSMRALCNFIRESFVKERKLVLKELISVFESRSRDNSLC